MTGYCAVRIILHRSSGAQTAPFQAGAGSRPRDSASSRRRTFKTFRGRRPRWTCTGARTPNPARDRCATERSSRIAGPASIPRSVRLPCARTFPNPPTADGMRLLDPLAGLEKLDSARSARAPPLGAHRPRWRFFAGRSRGGVGGSRAKAACGSRRGCGRTIPGAPGSFC